MSLINSQMHDPEDPDNDWHSHLSVLKTVITYCFVTCIMLSWSIIYHSNDEQVSPIDYFRHSILWSFTGLYGVILFSLFIESFVSEEKNRLRIVLQFVNMAFFSSSTLTMTYFRWVQCIAAGLYILCACVYRVLGWGKKVLGKAQLLDNEDICDFTAVTPQRLPPSSMQGGWG